jgi:alpha-glucosidase
MAKVAWWQRGVIYQVYPRSLQDSDGDGIGDLRGITQRLDHFVRLGIDALWISPTQPSPMADFGYDVAEYCDIDPRFGTLADFDHLLMEAHARDLRLVMDFVPNHTSDQHPWFRESAVARGSARRDWYIWRDPAPGGGPPNNWLSHFGGSAWEWHAPSGQYYLHSFLAAQPDLNWRNPAVRQAMLDVLRFWLDRGVDGFRVDVLWLLLKDPAFRDNPPNPGWHPGMSSYDRQLPLHNADLPETLNLVRAMREVLDGYGDRVLIGEIYLPVNRLVAYYGKRLDAAQLPFNFHLIGAPWVAAELARIITEYEAALPLGAWPNWVLGNHDKSRLATRVGQRQARVAAMLLLTLRGTPTIYYGDEIGMVDVPVPPEAAQDPAERNQPSIGLGRDPERSPMQWDARPGAGFTTGTPWLPIGPTAGTCNVAAQEADPHSLLALYRALLALRRRERALAIGGIEAVVADGPVLAFTRRDSGKALRVLLNFGHDPAVVAMPPSRVLLATGLDRVEMQLDGEVILGASEGLVLKYDAPP